MRCFELFGELDCKGQMTNGDSIIPTIVAVIVLTVIFTFLDFFGMI